MIIGCVLNATADPAAAADATRTEAPRPTPEDVIVVTAERAWEGPARSTVLYLQGAVEMRASDWTLRADEAEVHGAIDDPQHIVARGSPATATIIRNDEQISARALLVDYQRDDGLVVLHGEVGVEFRESSLRTDSVTYDIDAGRAETSGRRGVKALLHDTTWR